jgi:hypothetical protein
MLLVQRRSISGLPRSCYCLDCNQGFACASGLLSHMRPSRPSFAPVLRARPSRPSFAPVLRASPSRLVLHASFPVAAKPCINSSASALKFASGLISFGPSYISRQFALATRVCNKCPLVAVCVNASPTRRLSNQRRCLTKTCGRV